MSALTSTIPHLKLSVECAQKLPKMVNPYDLVITI